MEMEFIREFAHGGNQIGASISSEDRRERIRVAIYREQKHDKLYFATGKTYAEVFQECYGRKLEARRVPREMAKPAPVAIDELEDDDDESTEMQS